MSRRTTELLLILAATPPVLLLYAMFVTNTGALPNFQTLAVPLGLALAFAIAHVSIRFLAPEADPAILPIVFVLSGIGITFVTRLAPALALKQVVWLFLSIAAMIAVLVLIRNLEELSKYRYTTIIIGLLLLISPVFLGYERWGSKLWIRVGDLFTFQPGELAKLFIVLFLAAFFAKNREALAISKRSILGIQFPDPRMLLPVVGMWSISLLIVVFERDLGSALLFFTLFMLMIYTATGRVSYVLIGLVLLGIGGFAAYQLFSHVQTRFDIWLKPFSDPSGKGLQIVQSLFSLADGGLIGTGIGRGLPDKIPVVESDFIFSAIGEEMGLLGGAAVVLLFMVFAVRGFLTASRAKSDMAAFTAVGLTTAISMQAFIIIGGVTKLIPLTGITLPFMSQGGTSLLTSFMIVALLLRCGDSGTGYEAELAGDGISSASQSPDRGPSFAAFTQLVPSSTNAGGSHSFKQRYSTPESGVLGRIALGRRLTTLVSFFTLCFAIIIANLTYIQVIKAQEYRSMSINNHTIAKASYVERGSILTSDGVTLAQSEQTDKGTYVRKYPQGDLAAHAVGYISNRFGASGIEATQNDTLTGHANYSTWEGALNALAGKTPPGNDVVLTINSTIQRSAQRALSGVKGAIVVMDPRTGAILALASSPTYDNSQLADLIAGNDASKNDALYNRATNALYPPGSTFKVVTLAAALDSGAATLDSTYSAPSSLSIGGAPVTNSGGASYGRMDLRRAFAKSANTVFGQVATEVGPDTLVEYARRFGYGSVIGTGINVKASLMPNPKEMTKWETAWAGCGQPVGQHESPAGPQSTALQNCVVAAAVAQNGVAVEPYIVDKILSPEGAVLSTTSPRTIGKTVNDSTAHLLKEAMRAVVDEGTGGKARVKGVEVAGKTGTAETNKERANSLFIGFAPYDTPTVAISVVIEEAEDKTGASVASTVLRAALIAQGVISS